MPRVDKAKRREEILGAAKEVFAARGFHATTVADVARAAGLSYGSIYWYFDSKDALFHALMDHQEQALRAHVEGAVGAITAVDSIGLFRHAVRATFEFFEGDRDAVKLLFRDSLVLGERFDRHLGGIYEGFVTDIEKVVAAAQSAGNVVDTVPPRIVAFSVAALISQLALRRLSTDDDLPAEVVADLVVTLLVEGLRPRP